MSPKMTKKKIQMKNLINNDKFEIIKERMRYKYKCFTFGL